MGKEQRLPDGTWTKDINLFTREWDKIRKPFEALGFRVIGLDPGIALCDEKTNAGTFDLPLYAAKRIIEALTSNKK